MGSSIHTSSQSRILLVPSPKRRLDYAYPSCARLLDPDNGSFAGMNVAKTAVPAS